MTLAEEATLTPPAPSEMDLSKQATRVTIARGDGIGPEIMDATLRILEAAGARLVFDEIELGNRSTAAATAPASNLRAGAPSAASRCS